MQRAEAHSGEDRGIFRDIGEGCNGQGRAQGYWERAATKAHSGDIEKGCNRQMRTQGMLEMGALGAEAHSGNLEG